MATHTWDGFAAPPPACTGAVATLGNFDGVHLGHQRLVGEAGRLAAKLGTKALAVTFDPPPLRLLRPDLGIAPLSTLPRRCQWLHAAGAGEVLVLTASERLLNLSAEAFFHEVLQGRLGIRGQVEGHNFAFGKDRAGTLEVLTGLCGSAAIPVVVVPPVTAAGEPVSSSRVRQAIRAGDVGEAAVCLGRPYEIAGRVVKGMERGRTLGFPTANLSEIATLLPAEGVYAARARVGQGRFAAALNLGSNPTFAEAERKVEAHLLDFNGDLYGQEVTLELLQRLRPTQRFASVEELKSQLTHDIAQVRQWVAANQNRWDFPPLPRPVSSSCWPAGS